MKRALKLRTFILKGAREKTYESLFQNSERTFDKSYELHQPLNGFLLKNISQTENQKFKFLKAIIQKNKINYLPRSSKLISL